jgi:hypothetical protein
MKNLLSILLLIFPVLFAVAQDASTDVPVDATFETAVLIDNQTVASPYKGGLEFQIHHRFGTVKNGITDIFGVYAASNIRLGLNYGITDKLMVGVGTVKDYKLQDLQWKYAIIQQTQSGKMPVSVSYYGNVVLDARAKEVFGLPATYSEMHRFSYFSQLIIARKFNEKFSFQVAPSFFYYNAVEDGYKNANFGIHAGGRAKIIGNNSIILEFDQNLTKQYTETKKGIAIDVQPKPNFSFGYEIGTGTHAFQIFVANYSGIINQRNLLYNSNDYSDGGFLVGFNITARF